MLFEVHTRDLMMKLFELKINYCSALCFYKAGFMVRFELFCDVLKFVHGKPPTEPFSVNCVLSHQTGGFFLLLLDRWDSDSKISFVLIFPLLISQRKTLTVTLNYSKGINSPLNL